MFKFIASALFLVSSTYGKGPCDQQLECTSRVFADDERALCFGYQACKRAELGTTQYNPICNGAQSCTGAEVTAVPPKILCNGYKACELIKRGLKATEKLACNGFRSCSDMLGSIEAPVILCDGSLSCAAKRIESSATPAAGYTNTIDCNGNKACFDSNLISAARVSCDGDTSCKDAYINADIVSCGGKRSCVSSLIVSPTEVYLYGFLAAGAGSKITGPQGGSLLVKALGMNSFVGGTIKNNGADLTVLGYGYRALNSAIIKCKGGATCTVVCKVNACKNAVIAVDGSSTLRIEPEDCAIQEINANRGSLKRVLGVNCPTITGTGNVNPPLTEEEEDKMLEAMVQQNAYYLEMLEANEIAEAALDAMISEEAAGFEDEEEDESILMIVGNSIIGYGTNNVVTSNILTALAAFIMTLIGSVCYYAFKFNKSSEYKPLL